MLKKKILLPLAVVLALGLTACTANDGNTDPEPGTPPVEDPTVDDKPAADEETPDEETPDQETTNDETTGEEQADENKDISSDSSAYNFKVKPEEAFDNYMDKYPDTKVRKIEVDEDNGKYVYKVEGFDDSSEYELKMDTENGNAIKEDKDSLDKDENYTELSRADAKKIQDIVNKAMNEAGDNAKLSEWTLDTENGKPMLEVEIDREGQDDIEHTYNVETGELVEEDD